MNRFHVYGFNIEKSIVIASKVGVDPQKGVRIKKLERICGQKSLIRTTTLI